MGKLDVLNTRDLLQQFKFGDLFIEELGWSRPANRKSNAFEINADRFERKQIAELSGVVVFEISTATGDIPDSKTRAAVHKEIAKLHYENLLIFVNRDQTQSLWYWVKREDGKSRPREHWYFQGQPGDLFLSKLSAMVFDLKDFDKDGVPAVVEVANRLKLALDVEKVTKKFYSEFQKEHLAFLELIGGIEDERDRRWYASIMLNRLMFIYFLQRKHFINDGDASYLQNRLKESQVRGRDQYYKEFLKALFFEGFAKPENERSPQAQQLLGNIKYLNGGLFILHPIEERWTDIQIPDSAFENLFALFERYSWNLNDMPGGEDNELNPDVLGYIFEKYINQKAFGAYYTRPEITDYLCRRTIHQLILDRINDLEIAARRFDSLEELLMKLDSRLCNKLLLEILPDLSLLDPACGSGAFLVAAMKTLINIYSAIIGKIKFLNDAFLTKWLKDIERDHPNISYFIKKRIITDNLFGVDIMEEATEIAKLRLFLALVASAQKADELEPLPNIDFNIMAGNSLIGLMRVDDKDFNDRHAQGNLFQKSYLQILEEKNRLIDNYRHTAIFHDDLRSLRNKINEVKLEAKDTLDEILLKDFKELGIKFEVAAWDDAKNEEGKSKKRDLRISDIEAQQPFHWGYEFDEIINKRGGFDVIITNPPWETFKPQAKEFFAEHSDLVTKNKMSIKEFEKEQTKLLKNAEIRKAWLEYQSRFPHVSLYYRNAPQYKNQISVINGKKAGTDINLYKLFLEQCFNLLCSGGRCGIITQSGIYTDLGAKRLREMLFHETELDSMFGLSNEKFIFEGVHHGQKLCISVFERGKQTKEFTAAFRINPREAVSPKELDTFLNDDSQHITIPIGLISKLSPDSLSVMEFKNAMDIHIAEKMLRFPLLGEKIEGNWNLVLTREFDMTNDSHLFRITPSEGCLPLYEGKMIHQFNHLWGKPKYWLNEIEASTELLPPREKDITRFAKKLSIEWKNDEPILLDYKTYRLAFRDVSASTNERTMTMTVLPPLVFCPHTMSLEKVYEPKSEATRVNPNHQNLNNTSRLYLSALMNSFIVDFRLRQSVTSHLSFFFVYNVPIPRLNAAAPEFTSIVERAARLICTAPEFDELWESVKIELQQHGCKLDDALRLERDSNGNFTSPDFKRTAAHLRAELDAMIARLYGLAEEEFEHILATFPLVADSVKEATLRSFRELAPNPDEKQLQALIASGESERLEFKVAACWNHHKSAKDDKMRDNIIAGVAAFMNSRNGGALLIGVSDAGGIVGLAEDFQAADLKRPNRDGYELFLRNLISDILGGDVSTFYSISFHKIEDKDICRIAVEPSIKPIYFRGEMYVRVGNQKRKLTAQEAIEYKAARW